MSKTYRRWDPDQGWLLPPSPRDWLPEDDLVYFVLDTVGTLDISAITAKYERQERGYPPYAPRMMVTLLIYGYCRGVYSSRGLEQACVERVTFRVIVGEDIPNFRTISDFRKLHLKELEELFVQVLRLCQKTGLVKLGHVSLDGTKIKANASRHKAMSYGRMKQEEKRLRQEIRDLLKRAKKADEAEDCRYGKDFRGDELPEELSRRKTRLKRIEEAKRALEAEAQAAAAIEQVSSEQDCGNQKDKPVSGHRKERPVSAAPLDNKQYNFTDPESGIMKSNNKGWDQSGNAQAVVDNEHQIIVACDVTKASNDKKQVKPLLRQAKANIGKGKKIEKASMDNGYFSEENVKWLEAQEVDAYVASFCCGKREKRKMHCRQITIGSHSSFTFGSTVVSQLFSVSKLDFRKDLSRQVVKNNLSKAFLPIIGSAKPGCGRTPRSLHWRHSS
jgi:transposase